MWEVLEALFYWLHAKNKRLPTIVALILVALVVVASYEAMKPSHIMKTVIEVKPEPTVLTPVPQSRKDSQETCTSGCPSATFHALKEASESSETGDSKEDSQESSYAYFLRTLEDRFQAEGIDYALAKKLLAQMKTDMPKSGDIYDISIPIRRVFSDISIDEENKIKALILEAVKESFQIFSERNGIKINDY